MAARKKPARKAAAKKAPAKKAAARKAAAKKPAPKKVAARKPAAKKPAPKKVAAKKPAPKMAAATTPAAPKKAPARKPQPPPAPTQNLVSDSPSPAPEPARPPPPEPLNDTKAKVGEPAPDFELSGDDDAVVKLGDLKGRNVVLYFYPRDNTPGCTIEARDFSLLQNEFAAKNAVVFGVSTDDLKSHRHFKSTCDLTVKLLADPDKVAHEAYGVWREKNMYGRKTMGTVRSTFLIGEDGKVRKVWPKVKVEDHALEVLNSL